MKVVETTLATAATRATESRREPRSRFVAMIERIACRLASRLLPMANPDFDKSYDQVWLWWVEVDESGTPERELGFNAQSEVIVAGPLGNNHGFWTDSNMKFDVSEYKPVSEEAFAAAWSQFENHWEANRAAKDCRIPLRSR